MRRKNGKVIQVEKIKIAGTLCEIPLRLVRDGGTNSRISTFAYEVDMDDPKVRVSHKDPQECLKLAVTALEVVLTIRWEPMIAVSVAEGDECHYEGTGEVIGAERLALRVALVERGTRTDGRILFRTARPSGYREAFMDEDHSFIPDTPENRDRVVAILQNLALLGRRLRDLLGQGNIQKTLANLKLLALPEPKPSTARRAVRQRK